VNVKEEFEKLGGQIYDLTSKKVKSPLSSRKVTAIITRIRKLEKQITRLEQRASKASAKKLTRTSKRRTKTA
jgi:hypothetical protein